MTSNRLNLAKLKGIVFDLDGTLINSTIDFLEMKRAMIEYLESCGVPKGLLSANETNVVILEKAEKVLNEKNFSTKRKNEIQARIDAMMDEGEMEAIPTVESIAGAAEAMSKLKEMGYSLAILTRSCHDYTIEALRKTGMLEHFDAILGRGETPKPKPYAESLTCAAEKLGLKLEEIVLVGDHHIDYTCAENACATFIGVRTGPRKDESWGPKKPEVMLDSVTDLPEYLRKL